MRVFAYIARRYNSAAESTSLLSSVASLAITDPHKILLFSLFIKSTIAVFKMPKQLSEENGSGSFVSREIIRGNIY